MKSIGGIRQNLRVGMDTRIKTPLVNGVELVQRAYVTSAATTSYTVPYRAKFCVARVLGAGGHTQADSATPTAGYYVGGGGGCYARTTFDVESGESLTIQVGRQSSTQSLRETYVKVGSTTLASAEGGYPSINEANGAAGTSGIGDEIVAGTVAYSDGVHTFYGGNGVGDSSSSDSVLCAGAGVSARIETPAVALTSAGFGGGSARFYNGSSSTAEVAGGGGLIVLEFYDGDPR